MADERFVLTSTGHAAILQEIADPDATIAERRETLGDVNDDTGNFEGEEAGAFFDVKTSLEHMEERRSHLQLVLENANIRTDDPNPKKVDPGERVVVWDFTDQRERTFDLLGGEEVQVTYKVDDGGRDVSLDSPVGQALVGKSVGDVIEVEVPDGKAKYAIRRIEPAPQG